MDYNTQSALQNSSVLIQYIVQMFALNVQSACRTSLPLPLTAIQMLYFTNKMLVYLDRSGPCCDRWKLMLVTAAARGHN